MPKYTEDEEVKKDIPEPTVMKEILGWVKALTIAMVLGLSISFVVKPTIVSGLSMFPTLNDHDYLLMNRLAYKIGEPSFGDIVVFNSHQGSAFIKRVIGKEGDTVKVKEGQVWVNGKLLEEEYINGAFINGSVDTKVPKGHLFVMGDNRDHSLDSRFQEVGFVSENDVIGKVFVRLSISSTPITFPK